MKKAGKILKYLCFLAILTAGLFKTNEIMAPKFTYANSNWPSTATISGFYDMEPDTVDVLFLGSSVMVNAFSPQQIYNDTGIRSYNLGSGHQSIFLSYYLLKEALRFQHPQAVVLDCRFCWELIPESVLNSGEGQIRLAIDPMKWSAVKREAVHDICTRDPSQSELSYYLTNIRYHDRWKELSRSDFMPADIMCSPMKGYSAIAGTYEEVRLFEPSDITGQAEMQPMMAEYLDRITALCHENDIDLILIDLPGNNMNDGIYNTLSYYAEKNGAEYFNFMLPDNFAMLQEDAPRERLITHANFWGSQKLTAVMEGILQRHGIAGATDAQYEETRGYYDALKENFTLSDTDDIETYMRLLRNPRYAVLMAVNDDCSGAMSDTAREYWRQLGLQYDLAGQVRKSYYAVIDGGQIREEMSDQLLRLQGTVDNGQAVFSLDSAGFYSGSICSILIDGEEYSLNTKGLNIVVYDTLTDRVIDSVNIDIRADEGIRRKEQTEAG